MELCNLHLKRFDLTKGLLFETFLITVWYKLCLCDHSALEFGIRTNGVVNVNGGRISQDTTSRAQHPRPDNLSWAARHAYLTTLHVVTRCSSRVYPKMCI